METEIVARYSRPGSFINGVPTRDLSRSEFEALDDEQKRSVIESGAYEILAEDLKPAPADPLPETVVIQTRDGIQDDEATDAARVLQRRAKQKGGKA
jgi:hypothetical protein